MKTCFPTLAILLAILLSTLAVAAGGCEIDIDTPDDAVGGSDTDADDDDGSSGGPSRTGGDSDDPDDSDTDEPSLPGAGDDGSGGVEQPSACGAYCEAELACDDFYDSEVGCGEDCAAGREESGDCAPAFDELNTCLAALSCDDAFDFWLALSTIEQGEDPGAFPCSGEFLDYAQCLDAGEGV